MTIGKLNVLLGLNNAQFATGMHNSGNHVRKFRQDVTGGTGSVATLATMASRATIAIGVLYSTMAAVRPVEAFNQSMASSTAIMGQVSEETRAALVRTAQDVAMATKFSADETAGAYYYLVSAGMDAQQAMAALPQVARFAQAGMFDLATATDLATDAQSALGLAVKDPAANLANLTRVTDVLVKANTLANASVQQFSEALTTKSGAALRILGKDVEEGVAVLAAFADQGVKGAEAGTQYAIVLRDLQTKAIENAAAFEANRVKVFDSAGEMRHMADILADLEDRLNGMSDQMAKATLMQMGFSDKSVSALQTLVGTSEKIREYDAGLRDAAGTTAEVADKQLPTFTKGAGELKDAFLELIGAIGSPVLEEFGVLLRLIAHPLRAFAQGLADVVKWWREFTGIASRVDWLNNMVTGYAEAERAANEASAAMTDGARNASTAVGSLNEVIGDTATQLTTAASAADEFISKLNADVRFNGVDSRVRQLMEMLESGAFRDASGRMDMGKFIEANNAVMNSAIYEAKNKILEQGRSLTESMMTPQESMNASIDDANRLLKLGAISWQTYERAVAAARAEYERTIESMGAGAELIERGTQAGYAASDRWNTRSSRSSAPMASQDQTAAEMRALNAKTDQMLKSLDTIAAESRMTTNNTKDTAAAVQRIEVPETVEM